MLDLHAHVLPGIDDGPRTMAESLALLRALQDDGVQHVVATPHIYPGIYDNTPARIAEVFAEMRDQAEAQGLTIMLSWGAEVRLCSEMLDWLSQDQLTCLGRGTDGVRTVLVEMPDGQVPVGTDRLVARLVAKGLQPLIAHPERNRAVMESLSYLDPLLEAGAVVQLTAGSLLGEFGSKAQLTARQLLDRGHGVAAVASDSHNLRGRRPRMTAARAWLAEHYGEALALQLTETGPARLVGIGQVVFESTDGTVLRDLPAETAPGKSQQARTFELSDFPVNGLTANLAQKSASLDFTEGWSLSPAPQGVPKETPRTVPVFDKPVTAAPLAPPAPHCVRSEQKSDPIWSVADLVGIADFIDTQPAALSRQAPPPQPPPPVATVRPVVHAPVPAPAAPAPQAPAADQAALSAALAALGANNAALKVQPAPVAPRMDVPVLNQKLTSAVQAPEVKVVLDATPVQAEVRQEPSFDSPATPSAHPMRSTPASATPGVSAKPRGFGLGDFEPLAPRQR